MPICFLVEVEQIEALDRKKHKNGKLVLFGDGINDARCSPADLARNGRTGAGCRDRGSG
jgi:hypothetical protein